MFVDNIVLQVLGFGVGLLAGIIYASTLDGPPTPDGMSAFQVFCYFLGLIVALIYYCCFEVIFGRTVGKFLTGTKVVAEDGMQASAGQIFGRTLCRFIPFEAFSFFGGAGRPVGWHDSISKTRVVEA